MLLLFPFLLALGLFLPGYFVARQLRHRLWWASAFVISLLVLFHCVFWLGVFRVPITLWTVLPCLLAATTVAAWLLRKTAPVKHEPAAPWDRHDRILLIASAAVGAVLLARSAVSPLIGFDTLFRWDFLAQRLLALGTFSFYPPLTPADFRTYFLRGRDPAARLVYRLVDLCVGRAVYAVADFDFRGRAVCVHAGASPTGRLRPSSRGAPAFSQRRCWPPLRSTSLRSCWGRRPG